MQFRHDIYPGSPRAQDNVIKGDTTQWVLSCKMGAAATTAVRNLTGLTNYLGVMRDALNNPCTSMTDTTTGSNIAIVNAAQGIINLNLTGSWTLPFQAGDWTITLTAMNGTDIIVLGKVDYKLIEQSGV